MSGRRAERPQRTGFLFTMLLFLVFVLCALFTVLIGSRVYENITSRSDAAFTGTTAVSYIAGKVRQGDRAGMVSVKEIGGTQVLELKQEIGGSEYVTWIYWLDGGIRELFTDTSGSLGLQDGLEILECGGLKLELKGRLLRIETPGEGGGTVSLALRSGETDENE
ncbi:MAG: DUF4860 domain-containing protein [Enterocloster sp.]